jgi:hypothetical protein
MDSMSETDTLEAAALMEDFLERTGPASGGTERRYLWTDAFAVCNLLGLARARGDARCTDRALRLVDRVHHVLGRHRPDDPRTGWLSGADDAEGEAHPTRGGLRIGKPLPERGPGEPGDERREWDRDGQYFHYLTKWMHALDQAARATGDPRFNLWARELGRAAFEAFTYAAPGGRRMYWKISIDRSRALVVSMGHHDPLDGFVTCVQLQTTASRMPGAAAEPSLGDHAAAFADMLEGTDLATADPLGLGGLLCDACRVAQLAGEGAFADDRLLEALLVAALAGLRRGVGQADLGAPATQRLAFRELGLAIGLRGVDLMSRDRALGTPGPRACAALAEIARYQALGAEIVAFWRPPARHRASTWTEHRDINEVMLATALAPEGFLVLPVPC